LATKQLAHGVYEANSVQWFKSFTDNGHENLVTGGDDGNVNIWSIPLK